MERIRNESPSISLRDILAVTFRYRNIVLSTFFLVLLIGGVVILRADRVYEAKSKLLVKVGREYLNRSDINSTAPMMSLNQGEILNSEIEILRNENSVQKTIKAVGLGRIYPDLGHGKKALETRLGIAAQRFQKSLTVEAVKQSNVLEVTFKHSDPQIAAQAVNALTDIYKEKHLEVLSGASSPFLQAQLAQYQRKLEQSEQKLQTFKQANNVILLDEQRSLLLKQRDSLDADLKKTHADIQALQQKIPSLKSDLKRIGSSVAPYSADRETRIDETKAKLLSMQLEEQQLLKKYTETNPMVVSFRKEMALVKQFLKEQKAAAARRTNAGGTVYESVEMDLVNAQVELASLQARESVQREQLKQTEREVQTLDSKESAMQQLKREQAVAQKNYEVLQSKAEEARISETMDSKDLTNISTIERAATPVKPVGPTRGEGLLRVLALAVALSLGIPFALQFLTPRLATPEAAERRLGLKVLGTISYDGG